MAINNQIISKGIYSYPQPAGYVSVKQFIFLRVGEKKHLLVRFSNDLDVTIESVSFTVSQLDAEGALINKLHTRCKKSIKSGESFAIDKALAVDEKCVDVKVTVDTAISGEYEYSDRNGIITVRHIKKTKVNTIDPQHLILDGAEKADRTEGRRRRRLRAVAVLAIVMIILINVAYFVLPAIIKEFFPKRDANKENPSAKADYMIQQFDI